MKQIVKYQIFRIVIAHSADVFMVQLLQLLLVLKLTNFDIYQVRKKSKNMPHQMTLCEYFVVTVVQIFSSVLTIIPRFFISLWELLMATPLIQRLTISMLAQRHRGMK